MTYTDHPLYWEHLYILKACRCRSKTSGNAYLKHLIGVKCDLKRFSVGCAGLSVGTRGYSEHRLTNLDLVLNWSPEHNCTRFDHWCAGVYKCPDCNTDHVCVFEIYLSPLNPFPHFLLCMRFCFQGKHIGSGYLFWGPELWKDRAEEGIWSGWTTGWDVLWMKKKSPLNWFRSSCNTCV